MTFIIDMASGQRYGGKSRQLNAGEEQRSELHGEYPDLQLALVETSLPVEAPGIVPASLDMRKMPEPSD